jgi:hypothetical protein
MTPKKQPIACMLLGFGAAVFLGIAAASGQTYSRARVVRLSFVEGQVSIQRPDIAEWTDAPVNTPIEEGFKLATGEGGFAEVEFENGSTVRLGQLTLLEFTQLGLASEGSKINRLTLNSGYATFHASPEGQDVYEVATSNGTLSPRGKALFRVDVDSSEERLEVFNGFVDLAGPLGSWTLNKNSILDFSPDADQPVQLSEGITKDDWDRWVEDREGQEQAASNALSPGGYTNNGSDDVYGWSDLAYYGNWSYMSGYGYGWTPTVNAGWSPYSTGRWVWYPGFGFVWISADPWGWLPYHYGGWEFIAGMGWVWFPGVFGAWSPALVTWYGGPGWIGWTPRHGLPRPANSGPCPQGQSCGAAMSISAFKSGRAVRPGSILAVNPESGIRMERPEVVPDRQAMLTGRVVSSPARDANPRVNIVGARSASLASQTGNAQTVTAVAGSGSRVAPGGPAFAIAGPHAAPGPEPGIVFDPAAGRYVNNPRSSSRATQTTNEPAARSLASGSGSFTVRGGQPAPEIQKGQAAPAAHSQGSAWYYHSSLGSGSGSGAAPRSGTVTGSGKTSAGSGSGGGSLASGEARGGGGGGGSHGGGGGSSGGGGHH